LGLFINNMQIYSVTRRVAKDGFKPALIMFLACLASGSSHADSDDAINFAVGANLRHEDNLFRLPSGSPPPNPGSGNSASKSDLLSTVYAGIRVDKAYGLQRFQLDVTATQYRYRDNDYLNFSAVDYRGAWLWSVSPRLTGTVSADKTSELTSYANLENTTIRNKRTIENQRVTADWLVDGGWHMVGGVWHQRSVGKNSATTATGDFDQDTAEAGVRYVAANNNSIAAVHRESRGDYLGRSLDTANVLDTGYKQSENELRGLMQVTGNSFLDARLGWVDRNHDNFSQRDFSGAVGALSYRWTPTGKLRFTLLAGRDLVAYQESADSYYVSNYAGMMPEWLLTDKTTIRLKLDVAQNTYHGAVVPVTSMRDDTVRTAQLGVNWRPARTINVDGYLTHEQRSSNQTGLDYRANVASVTAALLF
jgi:exopolysaccharide biosynthesis operon protein EpsL